MARKSRAKRSGTAAKARGSGAASKGRSGAAKVAAARKERRRAKAAEQDLQARMAERRRKFKRGVMIGAPLAAVAIAVVLVAVVVLPSFQPSGTSIGDKAPTFSLTDTTGATIDLADQNAGKVVVLEFFWTDCPHCQAMVPTFKSLISQYGSQIVILSVGVHPDDTQSDIRQFVSEYETNWPHMDASQEVIDAWKIGSFPTTVILDQDGIITYRHSGELGLNQLTSEIDPLLR